MGKRSLEDCLELDFGKSLKQTEVEKMFLHIAQTCHAKIQYILQTHKHVGTIRDEVDPQTFSNKEDLVTIKGTIMVLYTADFNMTAAATGEFYRMKFDRPYIPLPQSDHWPGAYYVFVTKLKRKIKQYLNTT